MDTTGWQASALPRLGLILCACALSTITSARADDYFESQVRPVLVKRCERCHGAAKPKAGLRLDVRSGWAQGGAQGPAVVPGKPDESLLVRAILYKDADLQMPPDAPLPAAETAALVEWVRRGAPDPRLGGPPARLGGMTREDARNWWSFRPVVRPAVPASHDALAPIDAFLAARRHPNDPPIAPPADRRTLIRRATYDLTGLPPTPEDVDAFLHDASPDAFARVVDRLLASPAHGERWGRHWLDLARYADTAGENSDHPLPEMWRYRNWVIDAVNRDLPYDEFLRDQIAGDLRAPAAATPEQAAARIVATGYLAVARRFGHDIDKDVHLTHDDVIDTLGKSVLGLTLGCARCHAHKYDPIPAEDYYALYGILDSTRYPFPGCEPSQLPRNLVPLPSAAGSPPGQWAFAVADGTPRDARVLLRGEPDKLGATVPRHWLTLFGGQPISHSPGSGSGSGSGRLDLAAWLTDPANPLTARALVNRLWQYHFGHGLVRTPNDFGTRGLPPTHPELLDWLADEFVRSGWRLKPLHRLIMLSDAYQRSSSRPAGSDPDPDPTNERLLRFSRRRLDAEEFRDSLWLLAGRLDRSPGSRHPFPPEKTWAFTQHTPFAATYPTDHRAVYLMVKRNRRDPFLALFDGADPNATTPERQVTTVPTQALYFLNDPTFHAQADLFAARCWSTSSDPSSRLRVAFLLALQRPPTPSEHAWSARVLASLSSSSSSRAPTPDSALSRSSWSSLCRVLLSSNEFLYLD